MTDQIAIAKQGLTQAGAAIESAAIALGAYIPPDVRMRVFKGASGTDVTLALQAEFDKGGLLYIPEGHYLIDPRKLLNLRSGLYLVMHSNAWLVSLSTNLQKSNLLLGDGVSDAMVCGGHLLGDRLTHDYGTTGTSEWNHGIKLTKCIRVTLLDIIADQFAGDGASVSGSQIEVLNFTSRNNRRQALTIGTMDGCIVDGCNLSFTGAYLSNPGTNPQAGIDIEPDAGAARGIRIRNSRIEGNTTSNVLAWVRPNIGASIDDVQIDNCDLIGAGNGVLTHGATNVLVTNNRITAPNGSMVRIETGSDHVRIEGNTFTKKTPRTPIPVFSYTGLPKTSGDITIVQPTTANPAPAATNVSAGANEYR